MPDQLEHPVEVKEQIELGERAWPLYNLAKIAGFIGIIGSVALGYFIDHAFRRFYFAYLISFMFFLSVALGGLAFVLVQHLTRAGWSSSVRRTGESLAATVPIMLALSAPILISVLLNRGDLYRWAQPAAHANEAHHTDEAPAHKTSEPLAAKEQSEGNAHPSANGVQPLDHLTLEKTAVLNRWFFTARIVLYFAIWIGLAWWYWLKSTQQDRTGDFELTNKMQTFAAPAVLLLVVSVTFASFDLLMSLDPHWFSTIFGIYFLAGCMLAGFATIILVLTVLQRLGYLGATVSIEHYHDLGKWLFGFTFFWGYIAFSQYMLLWYSNIPEETEWLSHRGATTARAAINGWSWVSVALLFGKLLIPFAGLLSRHIKRQTGVLAFWAAWILVFHWVDLFWVAMPELDGRFHLGLIELLCFVGIGGIFMATHLRLMAKHPLRPLHDPRLAESVAFQNV
ncbi:MAG TPA: hypothetical protein VF669_00830 [Tepidisphaeraceae bacterium]|jgi:hypothetical protein